MLWDISIDGHRQLRVELRRGLEDDEWDDLLDTIILQLPNVDRVRFFVPELSPPERLLLETLEQVLTRRGVDVERREAS